jgi:hypothetical protein
MMRISLPVVAIAVAAGLLSFSIHAQKPPKALAIPSYGNAGAITDVELRAYLYFLASDQLEGRSFPSRGYDTAALYVASHLAEWGLKPGGSTSGTVGPLQPYFMPIEMESRQLIAADSKATLTLSPAAGPGQPSAPQSTTFDYERDWFFGMPGSPAPVTGPVEVSGTLVFAGNGWLIRKTNVDPYKGIDVRGRIIVVSGKPPELGQGSLGEPCVDFFSPQQYAARNGALAVVNIADSMNAAFMARPTSARASLNGPPFVVKKFQEPAACPSAPIITAGLDFTNALFAGERHNGAEVFYTADRNASVYPPAYQGERKSVPSLQSFALSDRKSLRLHLAMHTEDGHGENVIGILEGSDPVLKNEFVILSSHLDHLGLSAPLAGGHAVYNGADDDASGSAALLAAAHAYSTGAAKGFRPKRSIVFLWNGGEEKSYSGSRYFVQFPPIDLSKVVAFLHMDMIGRTRNADSVDNDKTHVLVDRGEVLLIGPNATSTDLENRIETVNGSYQKLRLNHFYDATHPDGTHDNLGPQQIGQRLFWRSDQFNFALMGIPVAYFTTGLHPDYHHLTDTPEKIDYQELQIIARTVGAIAWDLGNESGRPKLNATLPDDLKTLMDNAQKQGWGKLTPVLAPLPGMPF